MVEELIAITVKQRRDSIADFFGRINVGISLSLNYGEAILDFYEWEVDSGRISDDSGSNWWKVVNGFLTRDLNSGLSLYDGSLTTSQVNSGHKSSSRLWVEFLKVFKDEEAHESKVQSLLWKAHQASIAQGVKFAAEYLNDECVSEVEFTYLVLGVLETVSTLNYPTNSSKLKKAVRGSYPANYPISEEQLCAVREKLSKRVS